MKRYTKFLAMFLTVTLAMSLCACSDGGASGKRSREEQSENETKDFKAEGTTEPETTDTVVTSTEETTAETTEFTVGTCLPSAELTQLNEELLMLGFAEPDPIYTGPYADVYAQYPSFNSDYSGYPIVKSIFNSKTRERFYFSVAFYNPVSEQLNNPDYYMDLPYDVAFPEG